MPKAKPAAPLPGAEDEVPLANGRGIALVSPEDAGAVLGMNWFVLKLPLASTEYAQANIRKNGRKTTLSLHRFIGSRMGFDPRLDVDHRNHHGLDCRRRNLRQATKTQNQANRRVAKNSRSGVKGVSWDSRDKKWMAFIRIEGKTRNLGRFDDIEAATRVYFEWARAAHGEFAFSG